MIKEILAGKVTQLIQIPYCTADLKEAGRNWLSSLGTEDEKDCADKLITELYQGVAGIEDLEAFAASDKAKEMMGEEKLEGFKKHIQDLKDSGAKHCDCEACTLASEILEEKEGFFEI